MNAPPSPAQSSQDTVGVTCVIGITQFVFLSIGLMVLTILVKVSTVHLQPTALAQFLTANGLWLAALPLLWSLLAAVIGSRGATQRMIMVISGVVLAAAIAVAFTIAILRPAA